MLGHGVARGSGGTGGGVKTKASILVVEDDAAVRLLFRELLQDEGYCVRQAVDGIEALQHCADAPPDLMILDINMPRLDGVALVEALDDLGWRTFPVLVVSAVQERMGPIAGQVNGFASKPVDLDALVLQVSRLLLEHE